MWVSFQIARKVCFDVRIWMFQWEFMPFSGKTSDENGKPVPCNMEKKPGANHCEENVSMCFEGWDGPNKGIALILNFNLFFSLLIWSTLWNVHLNMFQVSPISTILVLPCLRFFNALRWKDGRQLCIGYEDFHCLKLIVYFCVDWRCHFWQNEFFSLFLNLRPTMRSVQHTIGCILFRW